MKFYSKIGGLLILFLVVGVHATNLNGKKLFEPYLMKEDFQGEGLGQWASYPPAQDIGYEPSITPTADFKAPGGRALMRVVTPNIAGSQRFGFIKKVRMSAARDSSFRFSYFLGSTNQANLELGVAGDNGQLYKASRLAKTNEWTTVTVAASEIQLPAGTGIEAVFFVTTIPAADPNFTYHFVIDDVAFSGVREASFKVRQPITELLDPWPQLLSVKSYQPNDSISLEVAAPKQMSTVDCQLVTQAGQSVTSALLFDDATHGDKVAGDGTWTNNKLHELRVTDPAGVWQAALTGTTSTGETVKTDVRMVIRGGVGTTHPRLFFSSSDREKLIERSRDPKLASLWNYIQTTAKNSRASGELANGGDVFELLDSENLLPSLLGYFDVLNRARSRIAHNAFDAYLTGNSESLAAAKSALLAVSKWRHWEPPWFRAHGQFTYYPAGQLANDVALAYDLLYNDLTEAERQLVRRALIEKSIIPTYKEYVVDNRAMANTSNWIAHTVGGALIAASSIEGDVKEDEKFDLYVNGLLRKFEDHLASSFLADGSYGEGISYQEFDAETLGPALAATERAFGTDYWTRSHVLTSLSYPIYTSTKPISASLDMGDTHPPGGHGISPIVYRSKDQIVRWYYSQFDRPLLTKFIFYDDSVQPKVPDLPTSKIFADKGNAVFRSGWTADDIVFLFRAGPTFNHHHSDQGAFLLTAFGEPLITEAGWSDYYKDPYYATFFTQAVGHNTVLVGGNPESQSIADTRQFKALNSYPRITDSVTSEFYDGVGSELSSVYQGQLSGYVRRIVFVKPNYFVVYDELKTKTRPESFDFLLHLPDRSRVSTNELTATYNGDKASLAVRSFPSVASSLTVKSGHIPYPVFATTTPPKTPAQPVYLDFKTSTPVSATTFLTAMVPARTAVAARSLIDNMTRLSGANFTGIRTARDSSTDMVLFRSETSGDAMRQGEWMVDAASVVVTQSSDKVQMFAAQNSKLVRRGNQTLFSSDLPMGVAARFGLGVIELVVNTKEQARMIFNVGKALVRVMMDGKQLGAASFNFNSSNETVSLLIPVGQHTIEFR